MANRLESTGPGVTRTRRTIALVLAWGLIAAGCGGGTEETDTAVGVGPVVGAADDKTSPVESAPIESPGGEAESNAPDVTAPAEGDAVP